MQRYGETEELVHEWWGIYVEVRRSQPWYIKAKDTVAKARIHGGTVNAIRVDF
jgi:hypothetical protein